MDNKVKSNAQIPFLGNEPKIGNNKAKLKTVKTLLPTKIFNPKPIGNICIKGTKITNVGTDNVRFIMLFDF